METKCGVGASAGAGDDGDTGTGVDGAISTGDDGGAATKSRGGSKALGGVLNEKKGTLAPSVGRRRHRLDRGRGDLACSG